MDDFNPYRAPGSSLAVEMRSRRPGLSLFYQVPSLLYASVIVLATLILLSSYPQSLQDSRAPLALLLFYAPVLCFLLLRWGTPRLVRFGLGLQALLVLWIIYRFIDNLAFAGPELRIGSALLGINLLALLGGLQQAKARPLPRNTDEQS
ncbi:hypothetical protein SBP02_17595 [Pseudomonas benzenivorans]|uniref:DUF2069 domain-containing protein n=1 Tax=Pseudomonas benzenivorans TaxID=556533 RepID=A0ABZ0PTR9_9PSED|nr:hypothetical protein [Pseudomonas benzenivorans]WPC04560.1 hypothetical protein SBP02_17595 [Pseudomonas benzenivorans]